MSDQPAKKVLVFAASAREGSLNKRFARLAAARLQALGGQATFIDLRDYPCPLFDEDLEAQGMPEPVRQLRALMADHDALLISTPEYNGYIPPLFKNVIDWLSRPDADTPGLGLFSGKPAGLLAASPGGLGGIRALPVAQQLMHNINLTVLAPAMSLPGAGDAFNEDGSLKDEGQQGQLDALCQRLVDALR